MEAEAFPVTSFERPEHVAHLQVGDMFNDNGGDLCIYLGWAPEQKYLGDIMSFQHKGHSFSGLEYGYRAQHVVLTYYKQEWFFREYWPKSIHTSSHDLTKLLQRDQGEVPLMIRVLVIDDDPNTRCKALVDCCDLRIAHGFDQIKFWLKHHKPQVIILDHDMPGFNGMDVVNMFWEDMICTPVIIWSHNHDAVKRMQEEMEAHAAECLLEDEEWQIVIQPFDAGRDAKFYSQFLAFLHSHHGTTE